MAKRRNAAAVTVLGGRSRSGAGATNARSSSGAVPVRAEAHESLAVEVRTLNAMIVGTSLGFCAGRFELALELLLADGRRYRLAASMNGLEEGRKLQYVADIIDAVGMKVWEELPQVYCRVMVIEANRGKVCAIGDILSDRWTELPDFVRCDPV